MFRLIIEKCAQLFKGPSYRIDAKLPLSAVLRIVYERFKGLLRCLLFGVKWSMDIRKLVFVGPNVKLFNKSSIFFGDGVTVGRGVQINGLSIEGVKIGNRVNIGPYTIIEATGVITDIGKGCHIGADSGIGAFSFIGAAGGVWIGENVLMGQNVSFHSENHNYSRIDIPIKNQGTTRKGIIIEDDCWIGARVCFLDGCHVARGCVVAAGSVVRGYVPPYSIAGGVPARVLRSRLKESQYVF